MNSTLSVIIPVYNTPVPEVKRCLESIPGFQPQMKKEILLVDDGSREDLQSAYRKLVADLAMEGLYYIRKSNGGVSSARNLGMQKATGDYILFVDSDDALLEHSFAMDSSTDILFFNYLFTKGKQKFVVKPFFAQSGFVDARDILWQCVVHGRCASACLALYRRSFLMEQNCSFREDCIQCEDYDFNFYVLTHRPRIQYSDTACYLYLFDPYHLVLRWRNNPEKMLKSTALRYSERIAQSEKFFGESATYPEDQNTIARNRVSELYRDTIELYSAGTMRREFKNQLVDAMTALRGQIGRLDKVSKIKYLCITRRMWGVPYFIAKLRMIYLRIRFGKMTQ